MVLESVAAVILPVCVLAGLVVAGGRRPRLATRLYWVLAAASGVAGVLLFQRVPGRWLECDSGDLWLWGAGVACAVGVLVLGLAAIIVDALRVLRSEGLARAEE
jgi:hypothetical protein